MPAPLECTVHDRTGDVVVAPHERDDEIPEESESLGRIAAAAQKKDAGLAAASAAAVKPVKHAIKIEAVK